jgi:hypothetical protein
MDEAGRGVAYMAGTFAGSLLIAFLLSRLGLYLRRSRRFEPGTVVGVHIVCFFLLGAVACSAGSSTPGSSALTALVAQAIVLLIDLFRLPRPEDYSDDVPQSLRTLEGARLGIVIASLLFGFALVYGLARPATDRELIAELERGVGGVPGGASYLAALKRDFPDEYRALVTETIGRLREQRSRPGGRAAEEQLGKELGLKILAMADSKAPAMAKAPTPALNAYSRSMKDYVLTVQRNAPLVCAALVAGPVGDEASAPVPPAAHEASGRILAARLDLARAGLDRPTERALEPPPKAALRQLADDISRRDARLAPYIGSPGMAQMLTARERCAIAVHYYSAIAELPAETSALVAAYDLSAAASPGSDAASAPPPGR